MTDIKLTRWATYLVPGSVVMFSMWILSQRIFPESLDTLLPLPEIPAIELYMFLVLSYIVGIAIWGLCYSEHTQKWLRFRSHEKRILLVKEFLKSEWRQKKYFSKLKEFFPDVPSSKANLESFDYHDFEFVIASTHQTASTEMNQRIIQDRETIGLLQSMILALFVLAISLLISAIFEAWHNSWRATSSFACIMLTILLLVRMLYVHYDRRQSYLVRDTIMAFLSDKG